MQSIVRFGIRGLDCFTLVEILFEFFSVILTRSSYNILHCFENTSFLLLELDIQVYFKAISFVVRVGWDFKIFLNQLLFYFLVELKVVKDPLDVDH